LLPKAKRIKRIPKSGGRAWAIAARRELPTLKNKTKPASAIDDAEKIMSVKPIVVLVLKRAVPIIAPRARNRL